METGDWRPVARAYGGASGDRGGRRRPRAQSHAGPGPADLRPHCVIWAGVGVSAAAPMIRAPRCRARVIAPRACIRWAAWGPNHDAAMGIRGEAPGRGGPTGKAPRG